MTVQALRTANHDAVHLRDEGLIRLPDVKIVAKAVAESRIVLTFDLDFGDILAVVRATTPSVVIFRLRNQTPAAVNPQLFRVIADCATELSRGAVVVVADERFRVSETPDPAVTSTAAGKQGVTHAAPPP